MRQFYDTSVFIGAFWKNHPNHRESIDVFRRASQEAAFCSVHSLAEVYATLTAMPLKDPIFPDQAALFIEEIRSYCTLISLSPEDYSATIEKSAARGFKSGMIYDALLLRCAEKAGADVIYTWNLKHFRQLSPELASKIRTP